MVLRPQWLLTTTSLAEMGLLASQNQIRKKFGRCCSKKHGLNCMALMLERKLVMLLSQASICKVSLHGTLNMRNLKQKKTRISFGTWLNQWILGISQWWHQAMVKERKRVNQELSLVTLILFSEFMNLCTRVRMWGCANLGIPGVLASGKVTGPTILRGGPLNSEQDLA